MGIDRNNFYGPYMRIWLPDQEYSYSMKTCPSVDCIKHKTYISEKYCSKCGCEVIELKYSETHQVNLHEFLEEELGYGDLFIEVEPHNTDYILAVPNFISKQGGWHFEDCDQTEILTLSRDSVQDINWVWFEKEDWQKLIKVLAEKDIKHECMVGVLKWKS